MNRLPACLTEELSASDKKLLADLALLTREAEAWDACRSEAAKRRLLADRKRLTDRVELFEKVAEHQAESLTALIAKADYHLREFRKEEFGDRTFKHLWAGLEMTLEQAIATLQQVREAVLVVVIR